MDDEPSPTDRRLGVERVERVERVDGLPGSGPASWIDREVVDRHGTSIGVIVAAFPDPATGEAAWLGIDIGGFDAVEVVIAPTAGAELAGHVVVVPHDRERVVTTPRAVVAALAAAIDTTPTRVPTAQRRRVISCARSARRCR